MNWFRRSTAQLDVGGPPSGGVLSSLRRRRLLRRAAPMLDVVLAVAISIISAGGAAYFVQRAGQDARAAAIATQIRAVRNAAETYVLNNIEEVQLITQTGGSNLVDGLSNNRWMLMRVGWGANTVDDIDLVARGYLPNGFQGRTVHNHNIVALVRRAPGAHQGCIAFQAAVQPNARCFELMVTTVPVVAASPVVPPRGELMLIAARIGQEGGAYLGAAEHQVAASRVFGVNGVWNVAPAWFASAPIAVRPVIGSIVAYFGVARAS